MNIQIQSIHFTADSKLLGFANEKVSKLSQFYDGIISSEIFLRLDNSDNSTNKVAEIKINVPGNDLYVKRQCKTFEEAIDTGVMALSKQVKRYKEKQKGI
ncbi:MAG: HPF/RaiA family ribosome-associated protein [Bacteroidetes bacterium]|jgi:putative sigma-54 modulation protein|nr:HPF/RaiA family ribosome-associated protein [Bacteroidota bacterium]